MPNDKALFFDGQDFSEADLAEVMAQLLPTGPIDDGVLGRSGGRTTFQVYADGTGMQVKVNAGRASGGGYYFRRTDTVTTIPIATAHASLDRIDRIVLRIDTQANTITPMALQGAPAATPQPAVTTTAATQTDVKLAQVYVTHGTTSIQSTNVTDERDDAPSVSRMPRGLLCAPITISTMAQATGGTLATAPALYRPSGRWTRLSFTTTGIVPTRAGDIWLVQFWDGGGALANSPAWTYTVPALQATEHDLVPDREWVFQASPGVHTYSLHWGRDSGTGTVGFLGTGQMLVEDLGAA